MYVVQVCASGKPCSTISSVNESKTWPNIRVARHFLRFFGADFDLRIIFNIGVDGVKIKCGQRSIFLVITIAFSPSNFKNS